MSARIVPSTILCLGSLIGSPQSPPAENRPGSGVCVDRGDLVYPGAHWSRLPSLAAAGWDERLLEEARQFSQSIGSHAVMIVDRGRSSPSGERPPRRSSSSQFARAC